MYVHHKFDHEFPPGSETTVSYMVCAEPRSGSSLLCDLLASTELAGAPTEFFDPEMMGRFQATWNTPSFDSYVDALLAKKTSPNGVFGFKMQHEQFVDVLADRDALSAFPDLRFVHISRRDRLRAAISFARALQDNKWASNHPATTDELRFDRGQIEHCLARIEAAARGWERFFAERSIAPLRIVYEEFVADRAGTVTAVLRHVGVEPPPGFTVPEPTLEKQADEQSERWLRRYREAAG